ncbi:MAG: hypothetical protein HGA87_01430 [Desulfobulbaceae bacterium]|nr:hypothetical protein [Desulfobulbaceae bacterium]
MAEDQNQQGTTPAQYPAAQPAQTSTTLLTKPEPAAEEGVKPEWLPEDLWDADAKTYKVNDLAQRFNETHKRAEGLRKKLSEGGHKAPEKADDYKLPELDDTLKSVLPADDPVMGKFRAIAHEAGVTQETFGKLMSGVIGLVKESGVESAKPFTEEELNAYRQAEFAKLGDGAERVANAVTMWVEEQKASGLFGESDIMAVNELCSTAEGLALANKLRVQMGGSNIPVNVSIEDGLPSDREIAHRYDKALKSGDPAKITEVEKLFERRIAAGRPIHLAM